MREYLSVFKDIIIGFISAVVVSTIGHFSEINSNLFSFLVENVIPLSIITFTVAHNKPLLIAKTTSLKCRNKDVLLKLKLRFEEIDLSDENIFNKFILDFKSQYENRIIRNQKIEVGDYINTAIISIDSILYEFNYSQQDMCLELLISTQIRYKRFFRIAEDVINALKEVICTSKNIDYQNQDIFIEIKFIDRSEDRIKNPFFKKIYGGFNIKNARLNYTTDKNTTVEFLSDSIIFSSISAKKDIYILDDIKREVMLFCKTK